MNQNSTFAINHYRTTRYTL